MAPTHSHTNKHANKNIRNVTYKKKVATHFFVIGRSAEAYMRPVVHTYTNTHSNKYNINIFK